MDRMEASECPQYARTDAYGLVRAIHDAGGRWTLTHDHLAIILCALPGPLSEAVAPDPALVHRICPYLRNGDECNRCPPHEEHEGESCVRGCYALAEEVVNIAQTGDAWRRSAGGQSLTSKSEDGSSRKNYPPSQAVGGWRLAELMRAADAPEPERPGRFDLSMNDAVIRWEAWASAKAKFTEACVAYVRAMISAAPPPPEGQS